MVRDPAARPGAHPLRLFLAVEIPPDVRRSIAAAIEPLRSIHPRARWVPQEHWHVTLKFLGRTGPPLVPWIEDATRDVVAGHAPVRLRVSGLGAFPTSRRGRVVWAGLDDPGGALAALSRAFDDALAKEFRTEIRAFTPHVTVARSEPPLTLAEGWNEPAVQSEPFTIQQVVLLQSHLRSAGPRYVPLATLALGG